MKRMLLLASTFTLAAAASGKASAAGQSPHFPGLTIDTPYEAIRRRPMRALNRTITP